MQYLWGCGSRGCISLLYTDCLLIEFLKSYFCLYISSDRVPTFDPSSRVIYSDIVPKTLPPKPSNKPGTEANTTPDGRSPPFQERKDQRKLQLDHMQGKAQEIKQALKHTEQALLQKQLLDGLKHHQQQQQQQQQPQHHHQHHRQQQHQHHRQQQPHHHQQQQQQQQLQQQLQQHQQQQQQQQQQHRQQHHQQQQQQQMNRGREHQKLAVNTPVRIFQFSCVFINLIH